MKPHEETWRVAGRHGFTGPDLVETDEESPGLVCSVWPSSSSYRAGMTAEDSASRATLLAAAPDMARALVALLEYASQWESWNSGKPAAIDTAEEALKKAGVL